MGAPPPVLPAHMAHLPFGALALSSNAKEQLAFMKVFAALQRHQERPGFRFADHVASL